MEILNIHFQYVSGHWSIPGKVTTGWALGKGSHHIFDINLVFGILWSNIYFKGRDNKRTEDLVFGKETHLLSLLRNQGLELVLDPGRVTWSSTTEICTCCAPQSDCGQHERQFLSKPRPTKLFKSQTKYISLSAMMMMCQ